MKVEFDISDDFVSDLVVDCLKQDYKLADPDEDQLRNAIDMVLEYYLDSDGWREWCKEKLAMP